MFIVWKIFITRFRIESATSHTLALKNVKIEELMTPGISLLIFSHIHYCTYVIKIEQLPCQQFMSLRSFGYHCALHATHFRWLSLARI